MRRSVRQVDTPRVFVVIACRNYNLRELGLKRRVGLHRNRKRLVTVRYALGNGSVTLLRNCHAYAADSVSYSLYPPVGGRLRYVVALFDFCDELL
jgi:hypothetical protein